MKMDSSNRVLPMGWHWARLGDVCEFLDSRRIPVNESERVKRIQGKPQNSLYPYYGANGQVGWIDDFLFDERLILLAEDGGNFGSNEKPIAYAVSGKYWVNNHAHVLRPRTGIVDFDFCLHAIRLRPDVGDLVSGSTRAKLNQDTAINIAIPLPPIAEQERIAARLEKQMEAVTQARRSVEEQLQSARELRRSLLRKYFNNEEMASYKKVSLGSICEVVTGNTPPRANKSSYGGGIPWIKPDDLDRSLFISNGAEHLSPEGAKIARPIPKGSVLVSCIGKIGKSAIADCELATNQQINSLVPSKQVNSLYLYYACQSIRPNLEMAASIALLPILNKSRFEEFEIPLPTIQVQKDIAVSLLNKINDCERLVALLEFQLAEINGLPSVLLRRAFAGRI